MNLIRKESIEQFENYTRMIMADGNAAGLAIAIVEKDGSIPYQQFFGYRDREAKLPVDENTIFGMASVSKSFTALAILQLVEKGVFSLNTPVSELIPEFKGEHNGKKVKVRHFLFHAGGYYPMYRLCIDEVAQDMGIREEDVGDFAYYEPLAKEGLRRVCEALDREERFVGRPGERMSYCNDGFAILGEIVHRYGGEPSFADYLRKHIYEPMGMTRSFTDFVAPAKDQNCAKLYSVDEKTKEPRADFDFHNQAFVLGGNGSVKSTLHDLCRYMSFYLNDGLSPDGTRILDEFYVREMYRPRVWSAPMEWYGFGLSSRNLGTTTVWGHGGSLPGVSSNICFSKDTDAAVIVLCNTEGVGVGCIADAAMLMYNGMEPAEPRFPRNEHPWSKEQKLRVTGRYAMEEGSSFLLYLNEEDELILEQAGKHKDIWFASSDLIIIANKNADSFIKFYFDENGNVFSAKCGSRIFPKVS